MLKGPVHRYYVHGGSTKPSKVHSHFSLFLNLLPPRAFTSQLSLRLFNLCSHFAIHILNYIDQKFILNSLCPTIQERVTATSISQMLNNIGTAVSFLIATVMVPEPHDSHDNSSSSCHDTVKHFAHYCIARGFLSYRYLQREKSAKQPIFNSHDKILHFLSTMQYQYPWHFCINGQIIFFDNAKNPQTYSEGDSH